MSDKSRSQWELQTVQREGLGQFRGRRTQCTNTLRPRKYAHTDKQKVTDKERKESEMINRCENGGLSQDKKEAEEEKRGALSYLRRRGGGEGGGADLLRVLNSCERPPVLLIWGSADTQKH